MVVNQRSYRTKETGKLALQIAFRLDASFDIGTGHLMRCLTLATQLRALGVKVAFIVREAKGDRSDYIEQVSGFPLYRIPKNLPKDWQADAQWVMKQLETTVDWLVVDHYGLDREWETTLRNRARRIMVIDDLANRHHDCDLLLDQNFYENFERRYENLIPDSSNTFLGPRYALLRPEFETWRRRLEPRDGLVKKILISYGGSDPTGETLKALNALKPLVHTGLEVSVVIGGANPRNQDIKAMAAGMQNTTVYLHVDNMAELMARADLALGACGSTTWERCSLGLPSMITTVADNQLEAARYLEKHHYHYYLGHFDSVTPEAISTKLSEIPESQDAYLEQSQKCYALVDGIGTQRVSEALLLAEV